MSTNAYIQVEGSECFIYKHWDGYPSTTLPFLRAFHKKFLENRGVCPDYETAQLLRATVDMENEFSLDDSRYTRWGVFVGNLKYKKNEPYYFVYILHNDGSISINGHNYKPEDKVFFPE